MLNNNFTEKEKQFILKKNDEDDENKDNITFKKELPYPNPFDTPVEVPLDEPLSNSVEVPHFEPYQTKKQGNTDFLKFDTGKLQMSLIEPEFVLGLAKILTIGAEKYAANNWKLLDPKDINRYKDSTLRHLYAYLNGELLDKETGEPHLDHIACNIMFLRYYEHQLKDNSNDS